MNVIQEAHPVVKDSRDSSFEWEDQTFALPLGKLVSFKDSSPSSMASSSSLSAKPSHQMDPREPQSLLELLEEDEETSVNSTAFPTPCLSTVQLSAKDDSPLQASTNSSHTTASTRPVTNRFPNNFGNKNLVFLDLNSKNLGPDFEFF